MRSSVVRLFFVFCVMHLALCGRTYAQAVQFGYLSYDKILHEMPQYVKAQTDLEALKAKYEAEAARGEDEFQKKFVDFIQGQKDFPQTILQKRQGELQTLMDNGVAFRVQAQELIKKAEKDLVAEAEKVLDNAILAVGVEYGYGYIMNVDGHNCPYINPTIGVDVSDLVRVKLGLIQAPQTPVGAGPATEIPTVQQAPVQVIAAPAIQNPVQPANAEPTEH